MVSAIAENVTLTQSGTLASVLGDKLLEVEEITIEGPIDDADFNTLWQATYEGKLKSINLCGATVKDNKIPANAFFHYEQADHVTGYFTVTNLQRIVLPEGITEIGKLAFAYSYLEDIVWPSTITSIDDGAFMYCTHYMPETFQLPTSLEFIGKQAFYQCCMYDAEVVLPKGLRRIESNAFHGCRIAKINFPESLEYIGGGAFGYNKLTDIILPKNCIFDEEGWQFCANFLLTHAELPSDITSLPTNFFAQCMKLEDISLPRTVTTIGDETFRACMALSYIRCETTEPPHCGSETFTGVSKNIPVYIPTETKALYESVPVWKDFTNFVETDMPGAGLQDISIDKSEKSVIYDLFGRPTSTPVSGQLYIQNGRKVIAPNK